MHKNRACARPMHTNAVLVNQDLLVSEQDASSFQILSRYDIAVVQEVRDSDLSAVTTLMEKLNR